MMCCILTWGIFSLAHCGFEAWPIMEDIEPISLGSEIWPREFETVTHLLMIRAVYYPLLHLDFALTCIYPLWALRSITLETIIWPFYQRFFYLCTSLLWSDQVECEEFEPRVDLAWQELAYDLWVAYDMWIGRLLDETVTYFAVGIEIDLVRWGLACDGQSCLMRSPFTLLWEDHLWDYYGAFGVRLVHDSRGLTWLYHMDIDI